LPAGGETTMPAVKTTRVCFPWGFRFRLTDQNASPQGHCRPGGWPAGVRRAGWAQLAPSPDAAPVSNAPAPAPDETPVATFKQSVNLVDLFFTVKDKNGNLVPHLTQQNCTVNENKEPQTLKTFVAETDQPLTLGILLDTSGSQQRLLPMETDAASQFIQQVLRSKDEAFAANFDVNVDLLQDYTNSPRLLTHALSKPKSTLPAATDRLAFRGWAEERSPHPAIPRARCSTMRSTWPRTKK